MNSEIPNGIDDLKYIRDRALTNLKTYEKKLKRAIDGLNSDVGETTKADQSALLRNYEKANLQLIDVMIKIEKTSQTKLDGRAPEINFETARREVLEKIAAYDACEKEIVSK